MGRIITPLRKMLLQIPGVDRVDAEDVSHWIDQVESIAMLIAGAVDTPTLPSSPPPPANPRYFKLAGEGSNANMWQDAGFFQYSDDGSTLVTRLDNAGYVFNSSLRDIDFIIKGDTDALLVNVDANADAVAFGGAADSSYKVKVYGKMHVVEGDAGDVSPEVSGDTVVLESGIDAGLSILTPNVNWGGIYFGSPAANKAAWISYNQSSATINYEGVAGGQMVFNSTGSDVNFIFNTDNQTNALYIDGGTGRIGLWKNNPAEVLDINGNIAVSGYTDIAEIADPAASASNVVRLFAHEKHLISLNEDDVWHDFSASAHGKSSFIHTEITISDETGLNVKWGAGSIFDALITGGNQIVTIAAQTNNQAMTANSMTYFYFDQSAGNIAYTIDPDNDIDWAGGDFTIGLVSTTHNDIIDIDQFPVGNQELHYIREIIDEAFHIIIHRGLIVYAHSGDSTWDIDQTAGAYTHGGLDHHNVSSRSAPTMRRWFHNASNTWESDTNAEVDADNWDDDDDSAGVTTNADAKWYRSTFYTDANTTHWVYPQVEYDNLNAALVAADPTPPHILEHMPKTITVVMRGNEVAFPAADSNRWIDVRAMLGTTGAGVAITDHGNLTGLGTGTDHSYIDQDVKVAASPTFADVFVPDGGTFGISGNELLTFNAAGTAVFSGCTVGIGGWTEGTLHVIEGSAGAVTADGSADTLVLESGGDGGFSILTPDIQWGGVYFGSPSVPKGAWLSYSFHELTMGFEGPAGGKMAFNGLGEDIDYVWSSDTETNAIFLRGSDGYVGFHNGNPSEVVDVTGNIAVSGTVDGIDIAGLDSAVVKHSLADAQNDFIVASGADTFVKRTLAETGAILEADIDHGNIQGLSTGADHSYIDQDVRVAATPTFGGLTVTTATTAQVEIINTGNANVLINLDANRTATDTNVGRILGYWNGTLISSIDFRTGDDTGNKDDGYILFQVGEGGSVSEAMRIGQDGNVNIGAVGEPSSTLSVHGGTGGNSDLVSFFSVVAGSVGTARELHRFYYDGDGDGVYDLFDASGNRDIRLHTGADSYILGDFGVGLTGPKTKLTVEGTLTLKEQAAADGDTATYGQVWVKNEDPCELWFTDDVGGDTQLIPGGGAGAPVAASYVTLGLHGDLTNERVLTGTANQITLTDGGADGNIVLSLSAGVITATRVVTDYAGSDGAQIQAAIRDGGGSAVPGKVIIPAGDWEIAATIIIDCADLIIEGCGPDTVIQSVGGLSNNPMFRINTGSHRVTFRDMWFKGVNGIDETAVQVQQDGSGADLYDTSFTNVQFGVYDDHVLYRGIYFIAHFLTASLLNCKFWDCEIGVEFHDDGHEPQFINCSFVGCEKGIDCNSTDFISMLEGLRVVNCFFLGTSDLNYSIGGTWLSEATIANTHFGGGGAAGSRALKFTEYLHAMKIVNCELGTHSSGEMTVELIGTTQVLLIENCSVYAADAGGSADAQIYIRPGGGKTGYDIQITNLHFYQPPGVVALHIEDISLGDVMVRGCSVRPVSTAGGHGIYIQNCDYTKISDCHCQDGDNGILIINSSHSNVRGCTVHGMSGNGIYFWAQNQNVTDQIAIGNDSSDNDTGIRFSETGQYTIDYGIALGNICRNNTTGQIVDQANMTNFDEAHGW